MTRRLTSSTICFALFSACASAHAEEVVVHERASKECLAAETVQWKLQGEQQLGVVLKEMSRLFCDTFFIERELLQQKINLHFQATDDEHELRERLSVALGDEGIDLHVSGGYDVRRLAPSPYAKYIHCKANQCEVARELMDKQLDDVASLSAQARLVPSMRDGKPNGFKMYAIRRNSFFGLLGFQNGDTIRTINDHDLSTPGSALEVVTKLRETKHFVISGERRGAPFTIDITIKS
jgi:hypothetical protein